MSLLRVRLFSQAGGMEPTAGQAREERSDLLTTSFLIVTHPKTTHFKAPKAPTRALSIGYLKVCVYLWLVMSCDRVFQDWPFGQNVSCE